MPISFYNYRDPNSVFSNASYGYSVVGKEWRQNLNHFGSIVLMGTKISGTAQVHGNIKAQEAQLNSLKLVGFLEGISSTFNGNLELNSSDVRFKDCTINGSIKVTSEYQSKILFLNRTVVNGNIEFISNLPGELEIYLSPFSVINGQIPSNSIIHPL